MYDAWINDEGKYIDLKIHGLFLAERIHQCFFVGCASPLDKLRTGFTQPYFDLLLELLKKNRNKVSIHYKARIKATDKHRDETVYMLYGLTKEEFTVVNRVVSK